MWTTALFWKEHEEQRRVDVWSDFQALAKFTSEVCNICLQWSGLPRHSGQNPKNAWNQSPFKLIDVMGK